MAFGDGKPGRAEKVTQDVVDQAILYERAKLACETLREVMEATHYHVRPDGTVVTNPATGKPVEDAGPKLRASAELLGWIDFQARIYGLYKPQETTVEVCSPDGTVLAVVRVQAPPGAVTVERPRP